MNALIKRCYILILMNRRDKYDENTLEPGEASPICFTTTLIKTHVSKLQITVSDSKGGCPH